MNRFAIRGSSWSSWIVVLPVLAVLALSSSVLVAQGNAEQQVLQSESHRLAVLEEYYPLADPKDWRLEVAGQRVQIIKPDVKRGGLLEFGTELVGAADHSLVALLGASPGASTAAFIAISVLQKCFAGELTEQAWLPKLKEIIPSYGVSLIEDADLCQQVRAETAPILKIENI